MQKQKIGFILYAVWVSMPAGSDCAVLADTGMHITENRSNDHIQRPWQMRTHS
jgi:hypothetical protein